MSKLSVHYVMPTLHKSVGLSQQHARSPSSHANFQSLHCRETETQNVHII
jgi:hypothetical protein